MSAPDTDPQKQARRHPFPIWGIMIAVLFGVLMLVAATISAFEAPEEGAEAPAEDAPAAASD